MKAYGFSSLTIVNMGNGEEGGKVGVAKGNHRACSSKKWVLRLVLNVVTVA